MMESEATTLEEFLGRPNVDLQEMLQVPDILAEIRRDFPRFVQYLKTRKSVVFQLINLVTTFTQEQLQSNESLKRVCYCATQILSNDDDSLMNIYFESTEDEIPEDDTLEMERLLSNEQAPIADGGDRPAPGEILHKLMDYLTNVKPHNDALDGYFYKIVNNIVRQKGTEFLRFMEGNQKETEALLGNLKSPSLGSLVVKMLLVDDDKKEYPFQTYKQNIVKRVYQQYLKSLNDPETCESLCMLIEEAFQNIKNKFFEVPEDFTSAMNFLVSDTVVSSLVSKLHEATPIQLETLSGILNILLRKMNSEVEEYNSYQKQRRDNKPMEQTDFILKFNLEALFDKFQQTLELFSKDAYLKAAEYSKHKFCDYLIEVSKSQLLFQRNLDYDVILSTFLKQFSKPQVGLLKLSILDLLKTFISKSPQQSICRLKLSDHSFMKQYFPHFLSNNLEQVEINMDQTVGMENNVIFVLSNRVEGLIAKIQDNLDVDLERVKERYNKCLGGAEAKRNNSYILQDDAAPFSSTKEDSGAERVIVLVGKNKNIPLTNLRDLIDSKKSKALEIKPSTIEEEKKLVIQIQQEEIRVPKEEDGDAEEKAIEDEDAPLTIPGVTPFPPPPFTLPPLPQSIPTTIPEVSPPVIPTAVLEPVKSVPQPIRPPSPTKDTDNTMKDLAQLTAMKQFICPFYQLIEWSA